tara:strand:+ start:1566 stop:1898 length:333 start_codon:yes stop_codon:yes gene_type:complete
MKKLTKKIITKVNKELMNLNFDQFENEVIVGWHKGAGLTVEEWMLYLHQYSKERGRKLFFALTDWGNPAVYFDATNGDEWEKMIKEKGKKKKRFLEERFFDEQDERLTDD